MKTCVDIIHAVKAISNDYQSSLHHYDHLPSLSVCYSVTRTLETESFLVSLMRRLTASSGMER